MEGYSVETKNRFQLILEDDDVDVYDILQQEEAKSSKKKGESDVNKSSKIGSSKQEKKDKPKKPVEKLDNNKNFADVQNTSNKAHGRDNRARSRQSNEQQKQDSIEKPASQDQQTGGFGGRGARRGGSAGFRGNRGGGGGGGGRGGPRRYDRHSGSERTGVKAVEKKEGFGSHNWGGEIDAQLDSGVRDDRQGEGAVTGEGDKENMTINKQGDGTGADGEDAEPAEPEVKEMTLDEYKAAQASARSKQQFNVRRAGEGEDPKQWKQTVALEPRKRAESVESSEEHEEGHDRVEGTRSTLNKLNIQIKFSSDNQRGNSRGGRGRNFGGPPRSDRPPRSGGGKPPKSGGFGSRPPRSGRGGFSQYDTAPKVDNEAEFPSLGSK